MMSGTLGSFLKASTNDSTSATSEPITARPRPNCGFASATIQVPAAAASTTANSVADFAIESSTVIRSMLSADGEGMLN